MPALDLINGEVFRAGVSLGQVQRAIRGGVEVWVRPPSGLSPATSRVMFLPNSLTENRVRGDAWVNGASATVYPWAADFRPEQTTGAYLVAPRQLAIGSDTNGLRTKNRWDQPDTFWPVNLDPRRDLAGVEALVVNQGMLGGIGPPYDFNAPTGRSQNNEDMDYTLRFVEAFVTQSTVAREVIIEGDPPQLLANPDTTDDAPWAALMDSSEQAYHFARDTIRAWLEANGHPDVAVRVIPYHRLAKRLYDDARAGLIPGGITNHRAFYAGWGEGGGTAHKYMKNGKGQMAEAALASYVLWRRAPVTTADFTARGVSSALASYLAGIVAEIATGFAPAGLGGTDQGQPGLFAYAGQTPGQIMPAATSHLMDFETATLWADRAGTVPATVGGPVGRITAGGITFTAQSDGARPIMDANGSVDFSADPMPGSYPAAIVPRYIAGVLSLVTVTSDNGVLTMGGYEVNHRGSGFSLGIYSGPGDVFTSVDAWRGGRMVFFEVMSNGTTTEVRVTDLQAAAGAVKVSRNALPNTGPVSGTAIQLSSDLWGNPNISDSEVFIIADQVPNTEQRARLYAWVSQRTGMIAW